MVKSGRPPLAVFYICPYLALAKTKFVTQKAGHYEQ